MMETNMGLLIAVFAVLLVGAFITNVVIISIGGGLSSMKTQTTMAQIYNPTTLIKIAAAGNEEVKTTASILVDRDEPYLLAVSPETRLITDESLANLDSFMSGEEGAETSIYMDIFTKCQSWLAVADPGANYFELDENIIDKYQNSIYETGGLSMFNPSKISELMRERTDTLTALCGETGCTNARRCAECWDLIEEVQEADQAEDYERAAEIEIEMLKTGSNCAISCAEVCIAVYPKIRMALGGYLNPELSKTFILSGIQLN